ncbi:hypothetical protein SAMN05414139_00527 [Burkholderia sp. D7]|nr:hypothetical protein SAMN05414139_00527 [Burkholderia sp. D7]
MSVELPTAGRRRGRSRRPADRPWITLESQFMASTKWVPLQVDAVLRRVDYRQLGRPDRGAVLAYLRHLSGYSRATVTRLVSRWMARKPLVKQYRAPEHAFARRYTAVDVALLAEVDRAMGTLSGPATACVLRVCPVNADVRRELLVR